MRVLALLDTRVRFRRKSTRLTEKFQPGVGSDAPDSISTCHSCYSCHCRRGHGACAGPCAVAARGVGTFVGVICRRGRLQMDPQAVGCGTGQMGQGKGEVGRLRQAGEGSESHRAKELVFPVLVHDELTLRRHKFVGCANRAARPSNVRNRAARFCARGGPRTARLHTLHRAYDAAVLRQ
jgi:hypothetical protein